VQINNNAFMAWQIDDNWTLRNELSINFLAADRSYWNEKSLSSGLGRRLGSFTEVLGGIYLGSTKQNALLSNKEVRPALGVRFNSNQTRRVVLTNRSRMEFRFLYYSNDTFDETARFRNRTTLTGAITGKSLVEGKLLFAYSYFEAFHNFENNTVERFFKLFKAKIGLGYRFSPSWLIDAGVIYLDSEDNVEGPSNLPTTYDTRFIFEWRVAFRLVSARSTQ
jgi:hypothetical protein